MGLDSIELLVASEDFFGIRVPDSEAATLGTVQALTDCIVKHLSVPPHDNTLRAFVLEKLKDNLSKSIALNVLISNYINPKDTQQWAELEKAIALAIPKPSMSLTKKLFNKILWVNSQKPLYEWQEITVSDFINVICAKNHEKLIDKSQIKNSYEVYVCVMAIMVDTLGLDFYDIKPQSNFAKDLGID